MPRGPCADAPMLAASTMESATSSVMGGMKNVRMLPRRRPIWWHLEVYPIFERGDRASVPRHGAIRMKPISKSVRGDQPQPGDQQEHQDDFAECGIVQLSIELE